MFSFVKFHVQVLQVAPGEGNVCDDLDLSTTALRDGDVIAQVAGAALDLDAVVQELLKGGQIEDLVADRLAGVDGVLNGRKNEISIVKETGECN